MTKLGIPGLMAEMTAHPMQASTPGGAHHHATLKWTANAGTTSNLA